MTKIPLDLELNAVESGEVTDESRDPCLMNEKRKSLFSEQKTPRGLLCGAGNYAHPLLWPSVQSPHLSPWHRKVRALGIAVKDETSPHHLEKFG